MIQITLMNVNVGIGPGPGPGTKVLQFQDPVNGIVVVVPMDAEAARNIGLQLSSSIVVAAGPLGAGGNGGLIQGRG